MAGGRASPCADTADRSGPSVAPGSTAHLPAIRHRGNGQSMEQTPAVVLLQAVQKSFPLDQGRDLQVLDIPQLAVPTGSYRSCFKTSHASRFSKR